LAREAEDDLPPEQYRREQQVRGKEHTKPACSRDHRDACEYHRRDEAQRTQNEGLLLRDAQGTL